MRKSGNGFRQTVRMIISCLFNASIHLVDEWLELSVRSDESV